MVGEPRSHYWAPLHTGRAQQNAQGWAGPWPAGRSGGVDRGGGTPHPLSCFPPLQRPITRQAPAPGVASRVPVTPKCRVFAGKNQSSWQCGGHWWLSGRSGSHARPRGIESTHATQSPSPAGSGARAGEWSGQRERCAARRIRVPARGGEGGEPGTPGCKTLQNFSERRGTRG